MTDKKEKILTVALELFANEGYNVASTSKIAKTAGVSEGLIFRHFENKKGLLEALVTEAEERINQLFGPVLFCTEPKDVIRKTINLPFSIDPGEYDFWKLQFKLKWETGYNKPQKMKPLIDKLTWAFSEMNYEEPQKEAELLNLLIETISTSILRDGIEGLESMKSFLLTKYI